MTASHSDLLDRVLDGSPLTEETCARLMHDLASGEMEAALARRRWTASARAATDRAA